MQEDREKISLAQLCLSIRAQSGLSAREFAESRGVSFSYIYKVEAGNMDKPSIAILTKLMRVYGLSKSDLNRTTVDSSFIDDSEVFANLIHPISFNHELSLNKQIKNLIDPINGAEELKHYTKWDISKAVIKIDRTNSLVYDKKAKKIKYIYDAIGTSEDGNDVCFLYIFNSSQRLYKDEDYIAYIVQMAKTVEGSIQAGMVDDEEMKKKNVSIYFATSSSRGFKLGTQYLDIKNSTQKFAIYRDLIFFDNRKGKRKDK